MGFNASVNYIDRFARVKSADSTYTNSTTVSDSSLDVVLPKGVYKVETFFPFFLAQDDPNGSSAGVRLDFTFSGTYTNGKSFLNGTINDNFGFGLTMFVTLTDTTGPSIVVSAGGGNMPNNSGCLTVCGVIAVTTKGTAGFKFGSSGTNTSTYYKGGWVKYTQLA